MALQILESVPSTMDVARQNVLTGRVRFDAHGRASTPGVLAREQTAGRGQRGRHWLARRGESLCATYYFRRGLVTPESAGQIAFLTGAAVAETVQRVCCLAQGLRVQERRAMCPRAEFSALDLEADSAFGTTAGQAVPLCEPCAPHVGLKWPNDVLLNGKKVGGILVELVQATDQEHVALIGVGINVQARDFPPEIAATATSLACEGVMDNDVDRLADAIARALDRYADLRRDSGFEGILACWRRYDATPGRVYETQLEGATVVGMAEGVDADGALRLHLTDGRTARVLSASTLQERR